MAELKLGLRFKASFNGANDKEFYRIVSVDIETDELTFEVEQRINNEIWKTKRKDKYTKAKEMFANDHYKYI